MILKICIVRCYEPSLKLFLHKTKVSSCIILKLQNFPVWSAVRWKDYSGSICCSGRNNLVSLQSGRVSNVVFSIIFLEQLLVGQIIAFLTHFQLLTRFVLSHDVITRCLVDNFLKRGFPLWRLFIWFTCVLNLGKTRQVMCFDWFCS